MLYCCVEVIATLPEIAQRSLEAFHQSTMKFMSFILLALSFILDFGKWKFAGNHRAHWLAQQRLFNSFGLLWALIAIIYHEKNSSRSNHLVKSEVQWAMTVSDSQTAIIPPQPTILISVQGISILPMQKEGCPHTSSLTRCYVLACPIQWKTDANGCMTCGCSKYTNVLSTFKVLNIEILVQIIIQRCPGANMTKRPRCR